MINKLVPRDVLCSAKFHWDGAKQKRFHDRYTVHTIKDSATAMTYTQLWKECGCDDEKTQKVIDAGKERGDLAERNGLYWWKGGEVGKAEVSKRGVNVSRTDAIKKKRSLINWRMPSKWKIGCSFRS